MSDSEPDWVASQSSAQKLRTTASRVPSSPSSSPLIGGDSDADEASTNKAAPKVAAGAAAAPKPKGPKTPAATLPLQLAPKVRRDALLLEAVDNDLDLSGDFGCIGRLHVNQRRASSSAAGGASNPATGRRDRAALTLDLKGRVYEGDVVPSNSSLLLVSIDGNKAKVEALFSDFVQLSAPHVSIFEMEAVQQGELGAGFFDDADDGSAWGSAGEEEALGPLKEKRGGGKMAAPKKGSRGGAKAGAGAKRKKAAAGPAAKRAKK